MERENTVVISRKWHFMVISLKALQSAASCKMRNAVAEGTWNQRLAETHPHFQTRDHATKHTEFLIKQEENEFLK